MKKSDFLAVLQIELNKLPPKELQEQLNFYSEMIDDRMEEGLSEEEAVAKIGSVSDILSQMNRPSVTRIGRTTSAKNKSENKNKGLITALVVMASPIWISLLAVWFSLVVSAVAVIWSLWISFIAVEVAFAASGLYGIVAMVVFSINGEWELGMGVFGAGLILGGLSLLIWDPCKKSIKIAVVSTKKIFEFSWIFFGKRRIKI